MKNNNTCSASAANHENGCQSNESKNKEEFSLGSFVVGVLITFVGAWYYCSTTNKAKTKELKRIKRQYDVLERTVNDLDQ